MSAALPVQTMTGLQMRGVAVSSMRDASAVKVEDVNWSVTAGDFWVIGGLQGAGKRDLLMLAGGLTAPAAGEYFFNGIAMPVFEGDHLANRLRLGYVFDGGQLFNQLTLAENIALPLRYHRDPNEAELETAVRRMLELTELTAWADSTPGAISRTWRKRAGLARALMLRPSVLLLDNPLSGLDARQGGWWLNFLGGLSAGGELTGGQPLTVIVTTEDFRPWRKVARQYALLNDRRFTVLGNPEQLAAASTELVRELSAAPQSV